MELSCDSPLASSKSASLFASLRGSMRHPRTCLEAPHSGALCRVENDHAETTYVVEIAVDDGTHELTFTRKGFEFAQRLFAILDTESRGMVDRSCVQEFVTLRCPVFWRRDEDLKRLCLSQSDSSTFDEIWSSVVLCSKSTRWKSDSVSEAVELGLEGWMVFCRFIALAQYLEGKRRFSARHLQQTMRHRNSPRGSEVVVVDVPPLEPPAPLSARQLANYENQCHGPLPMPELDLDHTMLAAHESSRRVASYSGRGFVKVNLFGSPSLPSFSSGLLSNGGASGPNGLDFAITFLCHGASNTEESLVRRSMADLKWLNDTFAAHKVLGGNLCGRILPPFPFNPYEDSVLNTSLKTTSGAITAAATSGVGRIRDAAKSLIGNYLTNGKSAAPDDGLAGTKSFGKKTTLGSRAKPESFCNPCSPASRARQMERYLNYLLEHPALSTSFALNTILKASQSGLEAAKESLEEMARTTKEIRDQTPQLDDGKVSISPGSPNLSWVRTAAQAAMALKVHGMLETTGLNAASARLQHASLPSFGPVGRNPGWEDDEGRSHSDSLQVQASEQQALEAGNFEEGVVSVQSELSPYEPAVGDDGYDLLPLPVPAPERLILSAGGDHSTATFVRQGRFHYGAPSLQSAPPVDGNDKSSKAFLGDIAVDENIGKLREVIGSVENTLSRCLASIGGIGKAQRERQSLHLEVVRGLDSWGGMRGKFISQRFLLKGVSGIQQSKDLYEEGDVTMIDDVSWQNSLAKSAVSAAEDVRSAVRASRTAANAKAAASAAAFAAQNTCDTSSFSNIDEARAAQTRASIAHSHAIHAAVVDHEAKSVMRRSALALAHDVKCWNVHRKREMLLSCLAYARSQHEATRRAVDAWSSLRDGFIGMTNIPSSHERRTVPVTAPFVPEGIELRPPASLDANEVTTTIYTERSLNSQTEEQPAIVAVDHHILASANLDAALDATGSAPSSDEEKNRSVDNVQTKYFDPFESSDLIPPFATAAPIQEEDEEDIGKSTSVNDRIASRSFEHDPDTSVSSQEKMSASMQSLIDGLMHWGGGIDEDHLALPAGMAASIAFGDRSGSDSPKSN